MDIYVLDPDTFLETDVVDTHESLIWTERWNQLGDFQLRVTSSEQNRSLLSLGGFISLPQSKSRRVMRIETREDAENDDGKRFLTVKGRSIESILDDRNISVPVSDSKTPGDWIRWIVNEYTNLPFETKYQIPFLQSGTLLPLGDIPESSTEIPMDVKLGNLLSFVLDVASTYNLGFRLIREEGDLYFEVYTGFDLTEELIFSPNLDNLSNVKEFETILGYKNVIIVQSPDAGGYYAHDTYVNGGSFSIAGFDRKSTQVILDEEPDVPAGSTLDDVLENIGQIEGKKYRPLRLVDGELNWTKFTYGVDYRLGDLVMTQSRYGTLTAQRVTEQIFISDAEGDRSYPTTSIVIY